MRKLEEVQEAKALMQEAIEWSVMKWMFEKARVREIADRANDALDRLERNVKAHWNDQSKAASRELSGKSADPTRRADKGRPSSVNAETRLLLEKVKQADDAARRARTDAENTFDEAERKLSISLAREGCQKAVHSWELKEKAIRKAEAVMDGPKANA